jgi:hypothetical protein
MFQYYSADLPGRDDYIFDDDDDDENNSSQSDLVRLVLNLAYFSDYKISKIEFTSEKIQKFVDEAKRNEVQDEINRWIDKRI